MITGTIKNAVKLQALDNKWQQKKKDINSKKPTKELTQEERMIAVTITGDVFGGGEKAIVSGNTNVKIGE